MTYLTLLKELRDKWVAAIAVRLAGGDNIRSGIEADLSAFFDQLVESVRTDNPMWIETTVKSWADSATQAKPLSGSSSMVKILCAIMDESLNFFHSELVPEDAVIISNKTTPVFLHSIDMAANYELESRLQQTQQELLKAQAVLDRVEKSKTDFISVAAHELKTPLTLIEGYTTMLHEAMLSSETERLPSALCIKGINTGTKRLREIVDDMIDVSMIENNLLTLNYQPVWINRICSAIHRELSDSIKLRSQIFTIKDFPGSNEMIMADGERIYQALRNIISNAVKYTPDGGAITIDGRILPGFIEVIITDTGIGINAENHQRIFEKFGNLGDASLHSSGKTKFKGGGPGLGLPITKGIIEAHGGAIWVESEGFDEIKCPGSVFHLMIPMGKGLQEIG